MLRLFWFGLDNKVGKWELANIRNLVPVQFQFYFWLIRLKKSENSDLF